MAHDLTNILLAEDNPADVFLVREALRTHDVAVNLHVVKDGEAAIRFIEEAEKDDAVSIPQLALLDLNLPRKSGLEVLARLRGSTRYAKMPVAIISSSRPPAENDDRTRLRPDRFFTKPSDYDQFMELGRIVKDLLA